jgi:glycosyltransferase involved in cell wall biosynthesis
MTSVRTGIDLGRFTLRDRAAERAALGLNERPTVGILATLRGWKGHLDLIEAWSALRSEFPEWQLLIVGTGDLRSHLDGVAKEERFAGNVLVVGHKEDPERWLACMDLFVLPSTGDEGVPQAIMQAMACGVPVISTPVGAIPEALQDGSTGLLTPPRNPRRLGESLARLMRDTQLRSTFGQSAAAWARQNFDIGVMLDSMERVFRAHSRQPR